MDGCIKCRLAHRSLRRPEGAEQLVKGNPAWSQRFSLVIERWELKPECWLLTALANRCPDRHTEKMEPQTLNAGSPGESWTAAGRPTLGRACGNKMHLSVTTERDWGFTVKPKSNFSLYHFACGDYISKFFADYTSYLKYSILILNQLYTFWF